MIYSPQKLKREGVFRLKKQSESAEELRRKYLKECRKQHPEKVKEYNRRYWERKAQKAASSDMTTTKAESDKE